MEIAFYYSFIIGLISIYIRYILNKSPKYKKQKKPHELSLKELLNGYKKPFLISIEVNVVENSSLYVYLVFFNLLASTINTHFNHAVEILNQVALGGLTILFVIPSNKVERERIIKFAFVTFIVVSYPIFQ